MEPVKHDPDEMNEIPQTRQSLLIALGRCDENAWAEFLTVYEKALLNYCRAKGLQDSDAHDVLQEVLKAVLNRVPTWDHDPSQGSFRGWLFRVARNIATDAISNRAKKVGVSGDSQVAMLLNQVPTPTGDTSFDIEYQKSLLDWASNQVRREVREVTWKSFCMTALEGQKAEQVAAELGVPVGNVYTSKCRVVARIKAKIAEWNEDVE